MSLESLFQWIGVAAMAVAAAAFLAMSFGTRREHRHHYLTSFLIVLVAATSYFAMAIGQSHITLADGHSIFYARYIDWSITTPLLLLGLATIAMEAIGVDRTLVYGMLAADVYMIATGFVGALSVDHSRWLWYVFSCGGFVAVLAIVWGPIRKEARVRGREAVYVRLAALLSVLWLLYPVVWALGEEGLRAMPADVETVCFTILDILAKVVFGVMSLRAVEALPPAIEESPPIVRSERSRRDVPASA
jgi:bacteriorhodopsin